MSRLSVAQIAKAREEAACGVDYSPRYGARCPWCQRPAKIFRTMPWEDRTRIRYHKCLNPSCVISATGSSIKSIEVDHSEE